MHILTYNILQFVYNKQELKHNLGPNECSLDGEALRYCSTQGTLVETTLCNSTGLVPLGNRTPVEVTYGCCPPASSRRNCENKTDNSVNNIIQFDIYGFL